MKRSLPDLNTIVVKVGSSSLCHKDGKIDPTRFEALSAQIAGLINQKIKVVLVSSGAVAAGQKHLSDAGASLVNKQAAAAIGQPIVMEYFRNYFRDYGISTAQVLLTHDDLHDRQRYLNARNTLENLLENGIVPIINENDTVSTEEIQFSDNDFLGALCTNLVSADLFIILSDIPGIAESDPREDSKAPVFDLLTLSDLERLKDVFKGSESRGFGRGGIQTKLEAPVMAARYGVPTIIANSRTKNILKKLIKGEPLGTLIQPTESKLNSWKAYIAHALKPRAAVIIDEGAANALLKRKSSLLASGILQREGSFKRGDGVRCCTKSGDEIARGIVEYNAEEIDKIAGKQSKEILSILGFQYRRGVIHRDNLVISKEQQK